MPLVFFASVNIFYMSQSFEVSRTSVGTDFLSTDSHHVMYSSSLTLVFSIKGITLENCTKCYIRSGRSNFPYSISWGEWSSCSSSKCGERARVLTCTHTDPLDYSKAKLTLTCTIKEPCGSKECVGKCIVAYTIILKSQLKR